MTTSLSLCSLKKRYGVGVMAVDGIDLRVEAAEFFTLLGPSGCGKSTLLRLIAGFETVSAGDILFDNDSVANVPAFRRNVGMVFQNYALFPHMTVAENIAFPLEVRDMAAKEIGVRVAEAVRVVRLEGLETRYPGQLSGGQQQRVALARAIVFKPRLLLMDEPLGALDRNLRDQMKGEIKRVHRALGVTVVYVTHDQDEALAMSDRIGVMRGGKLVQIDTPKAIYRQPRDPFVARFIGDSNLLEGEVVSVGSETTVQLTSGHQVSVANSPFMPGTSVYLLLRPEKLTLRPTGTDESSISGTITEAVFHGENTIYTVMVNGHPLIAKYQDRGAEQLTLGQDVCVTWSQDSASLLPRAGLHD